jgi:hypothetical protein
MFPSSGQPHTMSKEKQDKDKKNKIRFIESLSFHIKNASIFQETLHASLDTIEFDAQIPPSQSRSPLYHNSAIFPD